jgi:L-threonylcarbamoyladenylate synthase
LRPGALSLEAIEACAGRAVGTPESGGRARSPGMKYRHYSPRAELWLYPALDTPGTPPLSQQLRQDARQLRAQGRRVAAIAREPLDVDHFIRLPADATEFARQLFGWLRELDDLKMDSVLVEGVRRVGVGRAIMDRLERAASRVRSPQDGALQGEGS